MEFAAYFVVLSSETFSFKKAFAQDSLYFASIFSSPDKWKMFEQKETETGYIYYVHKQTGEAQNDNPKLLEMLHVIRDQYKSIKYITYRSATKLWFLKQSFYSEHFFLTFFFNQ